MSNLLKVSGESGLYKDPRSGGVVIDKATRDKLKKERDRQLKDILQENRINTLEKEIRILKTQVAELLRK